MEAMLEVSDTESSLVPERGQLKLGARSWRKAAVLLGAVGVVAYVAAAKPSMTAASPQPLRSHTKDLAAFYNKNGLNVTNATRNHGWPCEAHEELFFGDCYITCTNATNGTYPFRSNDCQCCKELPGIVGRCSDDCAQNDRGASGPSHKPFLENCPYQDEEMYEGLCYMKCSLLTDGKFPFRTGMNTCSNGFYAGNWTLGAGPCSGFGIGATKCSPHIPTASHIGYSTPGQGVSPMGFETLPMPNFVKKIMPEDVPNATQLAKILNVTQLAPQPAPAPAPSSR